MSLEIREIEIRMRVSSADDAGSETPGAEEAPARLESMRARIVEECVQRVLRLLRAREER